MSFRAKAPWHKIAGATLVTEVRDALTKAFLEERRGPNRIKQADIARALGVGRSVVHRQLVGSGDLGISRVGEIAAILGREVKIVVSEKASDRTSNALPMARYFLIDDELRGNNGVTVRNSSAHGELQKASTLDVRPVRSAGL